MVLWGYGFAVNAARTSAIINPCLQRKSGLSWPDITTATLPKVQLPALSARGLIPTNQGVVDSDGESSKGDLLGRR